MKFTIRVSGFCTLALSSMAFLSYNLLPMTVRAENFEPADQAPAVAVSEFAEGKQMLAVIMLLAAGLVGMERFCSWRLSRVHRLQNSAQPPLLKRLPSVPSELSSLFPSSPEAQRR